MRGRFLLSIAFSTTAAILSAAGTGGGGSSGGMGGGAGPSAPADAGPTTALQWYRVGYKASDAGDYEDAAKDFKQAIALRPDYAEAYNMLGFVSRKMGDLANAFAYYDKALKLKPNFPEVREYLGEAYLQQGDLAKAVQQYVILQKARNRRAAELLEKIDAYLSQKP